MIYRAIYVSGDLQIRDHHYHLINHGARNSSIFFSLEDILEEATRHGKRTHGSRLRSRELVIYCVIQSPTPTERNHILTREDAPEYENILGRTWFRISIDLTRWNPMDHTLSSFVRVKYPGIKKQ